jgi:predicted O-methyltransferase YrrM
MELKFEVNPNDNMAFTWVNGVKGTLSQGDTYVLLQHYSQLPFKSKYVETGSYLGCSGILAGLNIKNKSLVYCHDLWEDDMKKLNIKSAPPPEMENYFFKFYDNIKNNNLEDIVIPIRGDSSYTIGIHTNKSIDLAFIDGDHSFEGVTKDIDAIMPKMKDESVILFHDIFMEDVRKAIQVCCDKYNHSDLRGFNNSNIVALYIKD